MSGKRTVACALLLLMPFGALAEQARPFELAAWWAFWDLENGFNSLSTSQKLIDEISPFWYCFDPEGNLRCNRPDFTKDMNFMEIVRRNGMRLIPTIVNDVRTDTTKAYKNAQIIHDILSDPQRLENHVNEIADLVEENQFAGIDIDYEKVKVIDKPLFTEFTRKLANNLHDQNKMLIVTVPPKTSEVTYDGAGGIDWKAISPYADKIRIMCYNYSYASSKPGPTGPPWWIENVALFAKSQIPEEKIVMAFQLYGYDWSPTGTQVSYLEAMRLAKEHQAQFIWDDHHCTYHFRYTKDAAEHHVWFEDAASVRHKLEALKKHNLRKVALWRFGKEDPDLYQLFAPVE